MRCPALKFTLDRSLAPAPTPRNVKPREYVVVNVLIGIRPVLIALHDMLAKMAAETRIREVEVPGRTFLRYL